MTARWQRWICIVLSQALVFAQHVAVAQSSTQASHDAGIARGRAAVTSTRGTVSDSSARQVLPNYDSGSTAPQRALYTTPNLPAQATTQHQYCQGNPTDATCRAYNQAHTSSNRTPDPNVRWDSANVQAARAIEADPARTLTTVANFYSGCTLQTVPGAATVETRSCVRNVGYGNLTCQNRLTVDVQREPNCTPGAWLAHAESGAVGMDVQCRVNLGADEQHFRVTENGEPLAFFYVDMTQGVSPFPRHIADLRTVSYDVAGNPIVTQVYATNQSCGPTNCSLTALIATPRADCSYLGEGSYSCVHVSPFLPVYDACPPGTQVGNLLWTECNSDTCSSAPLRVDQCFVPSPTGTIAALDTTGTYPGNLWNLHSTRNVVGYVLDPSFGPIPSFTLNYERPTYTTTVADSWIGNCPTASTGSRCSITSPPRCTTPPDQLTRVIEGSSFTRDCWDTESSMTCDGGATHFDQCAEYAAPASGCTLTSSTCVRVDPLDASICQSYRETYSCNVAGTSQTRVSNCPTDVHCVGTQCFDARRQPDADFARSMAMVEATREAGVYMDLNYLRVLNGENNRCRDRLLVDCCEPDSAGRGMSNQSVLGSGSSLVFDLLMQSGTFLAQAVSSVLAQSAFTGSISAYGFTVYVVTGDAAVPVVSNVVYAGTAAEGSVGVIVGFDIWTLIIAIVIHILISASQCNENEARTAMAEGAALCHSVHRWCSHRNPDPLPPPGAPRCLTFTTSKCCFNSVISRIVNQQGRAQVGRNWGPDPENPDCRGFTIAELQSLNFAAMDLSEFYASLIPPGSLAATDAGNAAASRLTDCYYGQGRCGQ